MAIRPSRLLAVVLQVSVTAAAVTRTPSLLAQGGSPSLVSVTFSSPTIAGGGAATATITLSGPAGNSGFDVSLSLTSPVAQISSNAVSVASGLPSTTVSVSTSPTATAQVVTLTATARGLTRTGSFTVVPPVVSAITVTPAAITGGQTISGTVSLDGRAPNGGTSVALADNSPSVSSPASVTVLAGQSSATFSAPTLAVMGQTTATLTASVGSVSRTTTVTLLPPPLAVTTLRYGGFRVSGLVNTFTIGINSLAPSGGAIIQLALAGPTGLNRTADTIPAGQTERFHSFRMPTTTADAPFTVTASIGDATKTHVDTLRASRIVSATLADTAVAGTRPLMRLDLDGIALGTGPVTVTTDNPAVEYRGSAQVSGQSLSLVLLTNPVTVRTPVRVTATLAGSTATKSITIVPPPPPPMLATFAVSPTIIRAGRQAVATVTLTVPAPAGGIRVPIAIAGLPGFIVPPSIDIPEGATGGSANLLAPSVVPTSVNVMLTASLNGSSKSVTVRLDP